MEYKFQKLTPTPNVDLSVYENALQYVFSEKDIKNIAISGAYSSGKSSVIETYKQTHPDKSFLHISLAHFVSQDAEKDNQDEKSVESEAAIEGKILNQLIQQVDASKVPQTEFRIKRGLDEATNFKFTIAIVAFVLSLLHVHNFQALSEWIRSLSDAHWKSILEPLVSLYSLTISASTCLALFFYGVYFIVKAQRTKSVFRRLTIQGSEIELFSDTDDSYFDKYLNEVLYLFENTNADVIVFEDIDRFNNSTIFERLREINILVNHRLSKKGKTIRFFYLLRDDIFVSKDRTKFFDFILPIVPVIDGSNSYNKMKEYLGTAGIFGIFEDRFLRGLSLYIDDLRILKNIFNEFLVYYGQLNKIQLNPNKLLAMVTYKNLFPRDCAELQLQRGFVHALFAQRQSFIEGETCKIESQIAQIRKRIEDSDSELTKSEEELEFLYRRMIGYDEYLLRKQHLEDRASERRADFQAEIDVLRQKAKEMDIQKLSELITRDNIEEFFAVSSINAIGIPQEYLDVKGSEYFDLLKFLVRNGYIDETYSDYMTFFYENSLSLNDKLFLRSVTDKRYKGPDYKLDMPSLVLQSLSATDFLQEECLNHGLIAYILEISDDEKIDALITQLKADKKYDYIGLFLKSGTNRKKFVRYLNVKWPELFSAILTDNRMPDALIRLYSAITLCCSEETTLQAVNKDNCLRDYISSRKDYLQMNIPETEIPFFLQRMSGLGICFQEIDASVSNHAFLDAVYKANLYAINASNLLLFFRLYYAPTDTDKCLSHFFTMVWADTEKPFYCYIDANIETAMDVVLSMHGYLITDESDCIVKLLNHNKLSEKAKSDYISRLSPDSKVVTLSEVSLRSLRKLLIQNGNVVYAIENIIRYFLEAGFSNELIAFINSEPLSLDYASYENEDDRAKFWQSAISCNELSDEKYAQIARVLGEPIDIFVVSELKRKKFSILLNYGIIPYSEANLKFIRSHYPRYFKDYALHDYDSYLGLLSSSMFDLNEAIEVLNWTEVSDEQKIALISRTTGEISILNRQYSDKLILYILGNNLCVDDISTLLAEYRRYSSEIQEKIIAISAENMEIVIENAPAVDSEALFKLMRMGNISLDSRVDLLYHMNKSLNPEQLRTVLAALNADSINNNLDGGRAHVKVGSPNDEILEALQAADIIGNYNLAQAGRYTNIKFTPAYMEKYGLTRNKNDGKAG